MHVHQLESKEVLNQLKTGVQGLSSVEAHERLLIHGPNLLKEKKGTPAWLMFLSQFGDFIILVLIGAAVISGILGDLTDTIIILAIVMINSIVGFLQEYHADRALKALKKMAVLKTQVLRDGELQEADASVLVPGDVVNLETGVTVPADLRLLEVHSLQMDESTLTGESTPVTKIQDALYAEDLPLGDRLNMAFKGTSVAHGRGLGVVVATGMKTELGKIANMLQGDETETPLKQRMKQFGKNLSWIILLICFMLFGLGMLRGEGLIPMLMLSISLAVAAIPEALPALITIALANGARKMVRKNALVRKLPAVETLGSVSFICTDKTGTLTLNQMKVTRVQDFSSEWLENHKALDLIMALNHDVVLDPEGKLLGDPTEKALLESYLSVHGHESYRRIREAYPRVAEIPFDSDRKCMTTIHNFKDRFLILTKGALESLLPHMDQIEDVRLWVTVADAWATEGERVLAFGYRFMDRIPENFTWDIIETDLKIAGLAAMIDPPREDVTEAVERCSKAGIHTVMITGDHIRTAEAIARKIGILKNNLQALSGQELSKISQEEFEREVENIAVYARVSPEQKLRIIRTLQAKGHFAAMTGDGVNDAPSLKAANIGIAMGINGTDVSKEASDMILLDDRFGTIVSAVKEGRKIYENIRKFIKYIMTCNSAEIWTLFLAPLAGLPIPLLPVHILWINLVTDGLPGLALADEKAEADIMQRPPRPAQESLFAGGVGYHIIWVGILMAGLTLGTHAWCIHHKVENWQTMVFTVLAFTQLAHALSIRTERSFLFKQGIFTNWKLISALILTFALQMAVIYHPVMNEWFKTRPLSWEQLLSCVGVAGILFHAVEFEKWIKKLISQRKLKTHIHHAKKS